MNLFGVGWGGLNPRSKPTLYVNALGENKMILLSWKEIPTIYLALKLWTDETAQDIAEYAVMLALILVLVVGTIRLVGSNANNAFSSVASTIQ